VRYAVTPTPAQARDLPNSPCTIVESHGAWKVCEFGVPADAAKATIALVGDSHAANWRAALDIVARAKGWHGLSIALSGCPFSAGTRVLVPQLRSACIRRNQELPAWFARHPEIETVFVSGLTGAQWDVPAGQNMFDAEVSDYAEAWRKLPESVRHVVVIRDGPKDEPGTKTCIDRAIARHVPPGEGCAVRRRVALDPDPAVAASRLLPPGRVEVIDLTDAFCDADLCYPVIGGALVHKDQHHMTALFGATLGPLLLREVNRLHT
jgi:hypothetical protein